MRKFVLTSILLGGCLLFSGCGSNQASAISALSTQLDRLNNVVVNAQQFDTSGVVQPTSNSTSSSQAYKLAQSSLTQQNDYRKNIMSKTASIKSRLGSKDLKLSKNIDAIKHLTSSLSKYTTDLANTNNEYKKAIKSASKSSSTLYDVNMTKLATTSNTRSCCYENLLELLEQIDNIICPCCNGNCEDYVFENNYTEPYYAPPAQNNNYSQQQSNNFGYYNDQNGNCVNNNCQPNNNYYQGNNYRSYQNGTLQRNNGYGYNERFNPNRNTDTYAPRTKNIDTYRPLPYQNGYGNAYNQLNVNDFSKETSATIVNDTDKISEEKDEADNEQPIILNEPLSPLHEDESEYVNPRINVVRLIGLKENQDDKNESVMLIIESHLTNPNIDFEDIVTENNI